MDNNAKEIAYDILQHEYLKRRNISINDGNFNEIMNFFPNEWFNCYSLDKRVEIISTALKNNVDIEQAQRIKERDGKNERKI